MIPRRAILRACAFAGLWLTSAGDTAPAVVVYGVATTGWDAAARNGSLQVIRNPDLSRIVDGRYGDKAGGTEFIAIRHQDGKVTAQPRNLPVMEVVFDQAPPPRATLVLIFAPDRDGRLTLAGFISGDVGGDLVRLPDAVP